MSDKIFEFSFDNKFLLQKYDLTIDWKQIKFEGYFGDFNKTTATLLHKTYNPFKSGFKPSLTFFSGAKIGYQRLTFVTQKLLTETSEDLYEREYYSLKFEN